MTGMSSLIYIYSIYIVYIVKCIVYHDFVYLICLFSSDTSICLVTVHCGSSDKLDKYTIIFIQLTVVHAKFDAVPKNDFPASCSSHTVFVPSTETAASGTQKWWI